MAFYGRTVTVFLPDGKSTKIYIKKVETVIRDDNTLQDENNLKVGRNDEGGGGRNQGISPTTPLNSNENCDTLEKTIQGDSSEIELAINNNNNSVTSNGTFADYSDNVYDPVESDSEDDSSCSSSSSLESSAEETKIIPKKRKGAIKEATLKCDIGNCKHRFREQSNLRIHKQCHTKEGFKCPECSNTSRRYWSSLLTHLWQFHQIDLELQSCKYCDFKTPSLRRFEAHEKSHVKKKCKTCGQTLKNTKQISNSFKRKPVSKNENELLELYLG